MAQQGIKKVVIVGGGTAGWISAAALAKLLGHAIDIQLVESQAIGTVGVGEATIPQIRRLNMVLGLDEDEFIARTQGTFKLGIEFSNWGEVGERYLHTFGDAGINLQGVPFHHYYLRHKQAGGNADYWDFSLHNRAAYQNKFARMERVGNTSMGGLAYAFHFDAGLYAVYLREFAERLGVKRSEGRVGDVTLAADSGHIESIILDDGQVIEGDLFIDCSGFRGLLIGQALGVGYQDWSEWLPCNRAVTVGCERSEPLLPYTKSIAHGAGWQWRIPLQHRTGNGHVFCDKFMDLDEATDILVNNLDGEPLGEPRALSFTTGRRDQFWHKNCVSIGLASGFMEPLESTSIHLIQSNIDRLIALFPTTRIHQADVDEYNRSVGYEYERIRDFLVLHYKQTRRDDTPFWRYCRDMAVPHSLAEKLDLFAANGRVFRDEKDLFKETSWVQVMLGQGIAPQGHSVMADRLNEGQLSEFLDSVKTIVGNAVAPLPGHNDFIQQTCRARPA